MKTLHLNNFKKLYLTGFLFLILSPLHAQVIPPPESRQTVPQNNFWENVRFGGGIGLGFGNGFFSGTIAPSAIYQFNPQFAMGVGINGTYNKRKHSYSSTILGGSVMAFYNVIPELQLSAEFEESHVNRKWEMDGANISDSYWYPALFLGAGFRAGNVTIGLRYDVLYRERKSIYGTAYMPFVRVYF